MRAAIQLFFSRAYWKHGFSARVFFGALFAAIGVAYTIFKVISIPVKEAEQVMGSGPVQIVVGLMALAWAIWEVRPTRKFTHKLSGRDVSISLEVGDVFATADPIVIASNRTFDTEISNQLISPRSVQGQYTKLYYSQINHLNADIDADLAQQHIVGVPAVNKPIGKQLEYPLGTVAHVSGGGQRMAYWIAISKMNAHGVAHASVDDLEGGLAEFWQYIANHGGGLPNLRIPVIGTGFSKITNTREEVVRLILRSFVAACAQVRFCESLTIVIAIQDYRRHQIDVLELDEFLRSLCKFSEFRGAGDNGQGTAVPPAPAIPVAPEGPHA